MISAWVLYVNIEKCLIRVLLEKRIKLREINHHESLLVQRVYFQDYVVAISPVLHLETGRDFLRQHFDFSCFQTLISTDYQIL